MIKAYSHGWEIYYDGETWKYEDNNEIINGMMPCKKCNKPPTPEGYDACIVHIDGCTSACCGHGVEEKYFVYETIIP